VQEGLIVTNSDPCNVWLSVCRDMSFTVMFISGALFFSSLWPCPRREAPVLIFKDGTEMSPEVFLELKDSGVSLEGILLESL